MKDVNNIINELNTDEVVNDETGTKKVVNKTNDIHSKSSINEQKGPQVVDDIQKLADEVEAGIHGSGRERMIVLGDKYHEVQAEILRRMHNK